MTTAALLDRCQCILEQEQVLNPSTLTLSEFEELFLRHQRSIVRFIKNKIGNAEQADDLAQETFVKAYRALREGTEVRRASCTSWLYRIATNATTDALRRKRKMSFVPLSVFTDDRSIGAGLPVDQDESGVSRLFSYNGGRFENQVVDREIVERIFRVLPAKYSTCLRLHLCEGHTCGEIAELLHISISSVKMRLVRARERFAALYLQEMRQES